MVSATAVDSVKILTGDCRDTLRTLSDKSVHCCITSPPYYGLRSYLPNGHADKRREIGAEKTPDQYIENLVDVFREVRRVLRDDGTLWVVIGDCYARVGGIGAPGKSSRVGNTKSGEQHRNCAPPAGVKNKDLIGIPWMLAFALRMDGWYLRSDIVWEKPNAMPESVTDRPTRSHEYVFLLSKSPKYFYDIDAIREPHTMKPQRRLSPVENRSSFGERQPHTEAGYRTRDDVGVDGHPSGRNKRSVWSVNTKPFIGAHFATFPTKLVEPMVLASTSEMGACASCGAPWTRKTIKSKTPDRPGRIQNRDGDRESHGKDGRSGSRFSVHVETVGWKPSCKCNVDEMVSCTVPCTVLDPFGGSGTVAEVAVANGRSAVICELNTEYIGLVKQRAENGTRQLQICGK